MFELFRVIDWLMALPEELQDEFEREWETYEEAQIMPFMTVYERRGMEKGIERGRAEQAREMALYAVDERFESVPLQLRQRIADADPEWCLALLGRVLKAESVSELLD